MNSLQNIPAPSRAKARALFLISAFTLMAAALVLPNQADAAGGDLDPSFGTGGKVTTDFYGNHDGGSAAALQSDGKIVVAGTTQTSSNFPSFAIARYNPDGSLDSTFGTGGKVASDMGGYSDNATAVAIQADSKIVAIGQSGLIRYNTDGTPDTSFGASGDGKIRQPVVGGGLSAIGIQIDGKIVVAGSFWDGVLADFAILRFNIDGTRDTSFGTAGRTNVDFGSGSYAGAADLVIQPDGKIVAAGWAGFRGIGTGTDFALARLDSNGNLDTAFGSGGKIGTVILSTKYNHISSIALQEDGKIVAAGATVTYPSVDPFVADEGFTLARYNPDGSLDNTFGAGGKVVTSFSESPANSYPRNEAGAVIVQSDGAIVAAGYMRPDPNNQSVRDFALARYHPDGSLDSSFGTDGKVATSLTGTGDQANALLLQPDGALVAVGSSSEDFALVRYLSGATASPAPLLNISTRLRVLAGDNALIGGMVITGSEAKKVIIRAIGPSLVSRGISDALQDPAIELFDGANVRIAFNDNWKDTQQAEIEASAIPPGNDAEAAIVRTLAPGNYTAVMRGKNNGTGIGLLEAYDLAPSANAQLANISSRGFVDQGDNVLIGGFIAGGSGGKVVVRAIGPSLTARNVPGALQDPTLVLIDANGSPLRSNDNWKETQQAEIEALHMAPANDSESALIAQLSPGAYTAIVRGKNNTTGIGLVEVYSAQ